MKTKPGRRPAPARFRGWLQITNQQKQIDMRFYQTHGFFIEAGSKKEAYKVFISSAFAVFAWSVKTGDMMNAQYFCTKYIHEVKISVVDDALLLNK